MIIIILDRSRTALRVPGRKPAWRFTAGLKWRVEKVPRRVILRSQEGVDAKKAPDTDMIRREGTSKSNITQSGGSDS